MSSMADDKIPKGYHPNTTKALEATRWKKGFKPPGAGRPKGSPSITDSLRRNLKRIAEGKDPIDKKPKSMPMREWVGVALIAKAASGDVKAIKELLDRVEGTTTKKMELTGRDGNPLEIEHSRRLSEIESRLADAFTTGQGVLLPPPVEK